MAIVALTAARRSPGVSTAALALALNWPRRVLLIEADVSGSSSILAGHLRSSVPHERGLVDLAIAHQQGKLSQRLSSISLPLPIADELSRVRFIPGLTQAVQATSMPPVWPELAAIATSLENFGTDVIVDAGRLGTDSGPTALLRRTDVVLVLTRTQLAAVAATRAAVPKLRDDVSKPEGGAASIFIVTVGSGMPYTDTEIRAALATPVLGTVAWDPTAAEVYSDGATPNRRHSRSALITSVRALAMAVDAHIAERRARIGVNGVADAWA